MFHIVNQSKSYPLDEQTFAVVEGAMSCLASTFPRGRQVSETRFTYMGEIYEIRSGENPIVARRNAGTSTERHSPRDRAPMSPERQYDLIQNEGAEGYNPHRIGDVPTYWRGVRR